MIRILNPKKGGCWRVDYAKVCVLSFVVCCIELEVRPDLEQALELDNLNEFYFIQHHFCSLGYSVGFAEVADVPR